MSPLVRIAMLLSAAVLLVPSATWQQHQPPPAVAAAVPAPPRAPAPQITPQQRLAQRGLVVPVQGVARMRLQDTFNASRGMGRAHQAIDIMAEWGTPVLAADDGKVARISSNRAGGLALYQVDASGQFVYYYAHLAGYADGLREGQQVHRGDVLGFVGTTGNAPKNAPHLHFAVQLVSHEGRWWKGESINPYDALRQDETLASHP